MTSASDPGPADADLAERLAARGTVVKPSYLKRLRSERWIPLPDESTRRYSATTEDYVLRFLQLHERERDLTRVTLTLFGEGFAPREETLKKAYDIEARRTERFIKNLTWVWRPAYYLLRRRHAARLQRSALGRLISDRHRRLWRDDASRESDPNFALGDVIASAAQILRTGSAGSREATEDMLRMLGIGAMQDDQWETLGPIVPANEQLVDETVLRVLEAYQVDSYRARIRSTDIGRLVAARDEFASLCEIFSNTATVMKFMTPLPDAFGMSAFGRFMRLANHLFGPALVIGRYAPVILIVRDLVPEYDFAFNSILETRTQIRAAASFVNFLPKEFRRQHGVRRLQRRSRDEQRQLVEAWTRASPDDARAAGLELQT